MNFPNWPVSDTSEVLQVRTSFSFIGEPWKEIEWYFIPSQFVHALSWSVILSPLGLTLPSSLAPPISLVFFLLCKYYSACMRNINAAASMATLPHSGGHPGQLILFGPLCRAVIQQKVNLSPRESPRTITTSCQ